MITGKKKKMLIEIPEGLHSELKIQSVKEKMTMGGMVIKLINDYMRSINDYDNEPLTDDDLKDIEQARQEIEEGNVMSLEEYKSLWKFLLHHQAEEI